MLMGEMLQGTLGEIPGFHINFEIYDNIELEVQSELY